LRERGSSVTTVEEGIESLRKELTDSLRFFEI
jgi:hypothetical protein